MAKPEEDLGQTIGNLVQSLPFTGEVKARIVKQLTSDSRARNIFLANANHTKKFKDSRVGNIRVKGFSAGRKGHVKGTLEEVIKGLTGGTDKQKEIGWDIYIETITNYIIQKQKNLNELLEELSADNKDLSSTELLEVICRNAKQYEVLPEVINEFYEIWSFERVDNLGDLLSLSTKDDPVAHAMKQIKSLGSSVASINENMEGHDERAEASDSKIAALQDEVETLKEFLEKMRDTLAGLDSKIESLFNAFEEKQKEENRLVDNKLEELKGNSKELKSSIGKLSESFSSQKNEIKKLVSTELIEAKNSITESNKLKTKEDLDYIDSKLEGKMKQLEETLPSALIHSGAEYKSPLVGKILPNKVHSDKIKDEWHFINIWKDHLKEEIDVIWPIELVVIAHLLFKSSSAIIMDDDQIFYCWQRTMGWENYNLQTVASPTWMSEVDWENEVNYLFGDQHATTPKIVTIHQYNVALVSCYLAPTLMLWSINPHHYPVSKLVLIEANSGNQKLSADLLELATYFNGSKFGQGRQYPQLKNHKELVLGRERLHTGVSLQTFESWVLGPRKDDGFNSHIDMVAGTIDVKIPLVLKLHYSKFRNELEQFFSENDAKIVAAHHLLYPWLEQNYGDSSIKKFVSSIRDLFPNPLDY
jgi:archaellum component FlaC